MKVKVLRDKDTKEFVHIMKLHSAGQNMVFTSDIPTILSKTATMVLLKEVYPLEDSEFDNYDNFELVDFDLIESGEVGADIRNKLSPCKNLAELVKVFLDEVHPDKKSGLKELIYEEIKQSKKSVDYLASLL